MNDDKIAIALHYDQQNAPTISAKGYNELANAMLDAAKRQQVMVHQDALLADALAKFEVGDSIPQELYQVIAVLISLSYVLRGEVPKHWNRPLQHIDMKI